MLNYYKGNYVLEVDPNEVDGLTYEYSRKMSVLDNRTGVQSLYDVAGFIGQQFAFFARGRAANHQLMSLFYTLDGRRVPIWLPSVYIDFELIADVFETDSSLDVRECGFTRTGGPNTNRQHILIYLRNGVRLYRKLTASAQIDGGERIAFDPPLGVYIAPADVRRISFLVLSRLDQDRIELVRPTDTRGLTIANVVFKTDPGIGPAESAVDPDDPPDPLLPPVFDPFRVPDQMLMGFDPFGSLGMSESVDPTTYSFIAMQQFLDTGFPSDLIVPNVGNNEFSLPLTGSFRVSLQCFFEFDFGIPATLKFRVVFFNTALDPIEVSIVIAGIDDNQIFHVGGDLYRTVAPLIIPVADRQAIVATDPLLPVRIQAQYITSGWAADTGGPILGMNIYASPGADGNADPYTQGDAFMKIEWWS